MRTCRALQVLCVVAVAVACGSEADGKLLFYHSFDNGFQADYAGGSTAAVRHYMLELVPGKTGRGLWVKPNEYIRFETAGNIDLEEGTLIMWVKPNFDPPHFRSEYGAAMQCLFAARIRTGQLIELRLRMDKNQPRLWLMTGKERGKRTSLYQQVQDWRAGQWHKIVVSWQQPGRLALQVDDLPAQVVENANLPLLPEAMLYDMYFGTNTKQCRLGRMEHFDGVIDDIIIYDKWLQTAKPRDIPAPERPTVPGYFNRQPRWVGQDGSRINFYVKPVSNRWAQVPVKVRVTLADGWQKLSAPEQRRAVKSLRLVRYDAVSGEPVIWDESRNDEAKYFMPFQISDAIYWADTADLRFVHRGTEEAGYTLYYDPSQGYRDYYPKQIPMVGNGDRLRVGLKDSIGRLCSGIGGVFDVADIDGDGDLDLWLNSGTALTRSAQDLMSGHFFYENVSNEYGVEDLFAPPQYIIGDNTPYGSVTSLVVPNLCDLNHDGKLDVLMFGRFNREWWEWKLVQGRPVVTSFHKLRFKGTCPDREYRTVFYDWDQDGLGDLVVGFLPNITQDELMPVAQVLRNVGTRDEPVFDADDPIAIRVKPVQLQWQYVPVDWDQDGRTDIVSSGFIHELYFYKNTGTNTQPTFAAPERLQTYDRREIAITNQLVDIKIVDWDGDGDLDVLWGCEDGVVGLVENMAGPGRRPQLKQTVFLQQLRPVVDGGSISVPVITDWDDDGDDDLLISASNAMQYYRNLGSNACPVWDWPCDMRAADSVIQLRAGDDGSVQGVEELGWQYNNAEVTDWDGDGLKDLIISGIRGEHVFYRNIGRVGAPRLARGRLIEVEWRGPTVYPEWSSFKPQGKELITVWRTRPVALDWNKDGLVDYITLDHRGELALYLRARDKSGRLILQPPVYPFKIEGPFSQALVWNRPPNAPGRLQGRTVLNIVDWDNDGDYDLIMDNLNARYYENTGDNAKPVFVDRGDLVKERLANHNTGPYVVDWDRDGWMDLFVGAESGRVFFFSRPYIENEVPVVIVVD